MPTAGTAAHAWTLLHEDEQDAFRAQVEALGPETTLLVDTYDIRRGIERAVRVAGPGLGAVRIDSGDLGVLAAPGPGAAGRARRRRAQDRRDRRPRRVRHRRAARRARRLPTASVRRWSPVRARRPRAWSTSWWRSTGGRSPSERGEGVPRRPEVRGTPVQADGHGDRGGRARGGRRRPRSGRTTACAGAADAGRRAGSRPGDARAVARSGCGGAACRCRGRG